MPQKQVQILDDAAIKQKVTRMAYEIVEDCYDDKEIFMVGIEPNGYEFAKLLKAAIEKIEGQKVNLSSLAIDKVKPNVQEIVTSIEKDTLLNGKTIVLVDDVGNTGRTMFYSLHAFMHLKPKKIKTAILVERQHKSFPVASDFVGLSLSTTMKEHIRVEFVKGKGRAYLE
jgi:pyrimidine operon attenuation protein/uracil phosphoribosyltransferase